MTTNMITAARLLAHKTINGKYQSTFQLDKMPVLGHQMVRLGDGVVAQGLTVTGALNRLLHHR